ncbi:MAG: sugar transferase [Chthoniobacter sp.]
MERSCIGNRPVPSSIVNGGSGKTASSSKSSRSAACARTRKHRGKVGWTTKNDPRRLRIGAMMRKWNIDEVPQFWNVLKGEMSLVGPRPERPELIRNFKHEIPHYNARHAAKPGITGWAQVNGLRGDTDLTERIKCDLWYLENWSAVLDIQIMLLTFFKREHAC